MGSNPIRNGPYSEGAGADLVIVGAGAAGLWSAIAAGRRRRELMAGVSSPPPRIVIIDSRKVVGAKILMSGGTRCNLTHTVVRATDYRGGNPRRIARFFRAHGPEETLRVFADLGLGTIAEEDRIYPADERSASVLAALFGGLEREGIDLLTERRWVGLEATSRDSGDAGWRVRTIGRDGSPLPPIEARRVILATGGCSYPRTGSDGAGLAIVRRLGHTVIAPAPALTPFRLSGRFHTPLAGVAAPVELRLFEEGRETARAHGPLLLTHQGVSGPAALDLSGFWSRARADRPTATLEVRASFLPGRMAEQVEAEWIELGERNPRRTVRALFHQIPARLLAALLHEAGLAPASLLAQTPRDLRRSALRHLLAFPLPVEDVLGFGKAEVTSGGVPLEEVKDDCESAVLPGVYLAGEMLHVDGRLGGFNFQWAWSTGAVAGRSAVDRLMTPA